MQELSKKQLSFLGILLIVGIMLNIVFFFGFYGFGQKVIMVLSLPLAAFIALFLVESMPNNRRYR